MEFEDLCETVESIIKNPKRYKVYLTYERIVWADDEEKAIENAEEELENDVLNGDGIINDSVEVELI